MKKKSKIVFNLQLFIRKNKFIVTLLLTFVMGFLCYTSFNEIVKDATKLIKMPVAKEFLNSGTIISVDDIEYIEVPQYIVEGTYSKVENIVGKYVNTYNSVAKGSLFYKELLVDENSINDASVFQLNEGEVALSIDADIKSSYANSILVGHYIDLYYLGKATMLNSTNLDEQLVVYGEIVKNCRVIAVKDKTGNSVDTDTEAETAVIVIALNQEDAHIVEIAKAVGEVSPVISYDNLNEKNTANYYDITKMKNIILGNSIDVQLVIPSYEEKSESLVNSNDEEIKNDGN